MALNLAVWNFNSLPNSINFSMLRSPPGFPESNALVEWTVQTPKKLLKKACEDNKDPYLAILELRNTPITGFGFSPTQLLMGRYIRRKIPCKANGLRPQWSSESAWRKTSPLNHQNLEIVSGCDREEPGNQQCCWGSVTKANQDHILHCESQWLSLQAKLKGYSEDAEVSSAFPGVTDNDLIIKLWFLLLKANRFNHCTSMLNPVFKSFPFTTVSCSDFPARGLEPIRNAKIFWVNNKVCYHSFKICRRFWLAPIPPANSS